MSSVKLSHYMTDLLNRQTGMITRAIADLNSIRGDLPPHRQAEVDAVIRTLQTAASEDREALSLLVGTTAAPQSSE